MNPFTAGDTTYDRSIAIDASTVGDITVTVGVGAERTDELEILDTIYTAAEGYPFFPFRDKSHDLDYGSSVEFYERVIDANSHRLNATTHLGRDGSDPERVEAVQSAVLTHQIGDSNSLVILDGNKDKTERFGRAIAGLSDHCPPVTSCIQSEIYYPTSLLADLCANHLARQIDHPRHCSELTPSAPITKESYNQYWGIAYNSMINSSKQVRTEPVEQRRAETVCARMNCWFNGQMGGGEPADHSGSTQPIAIHARQKGYEELADRLLRV